MTPEFLEAILDGAARKRPKLLEVEIPGRVPSRGQQRFLAMRLRQMREDPRVPEWCPHAVVLDGR